MSKYSYLNLNQKMIRIRKKMPVLIRRRYSDEVTYDFVKLDDIYESMTPAMNKYGVDFDILGEKPTQVDAGGNPVYLTMLGNLWRYEADLELCWTNADNAQERSRAVIHIIGTNDIPDKAKGAAWTYGLKYYLLNKFNIMQAATDDPDMSGKVPAGEPGTPGREKSKKAVKDGGKTAGQNPAETEAAGENDLIPENIFERGEEPVQFPRMYGKDSAAVQEKGKSRNGNAVTMPTDSTEEKGAYHASVLEDEDGFRFVSESEEVPFFEDDGMDRAENGTHGLDGKQAYPEEEISEEEKAEESFDEEGFDGDADFVQEEQEEPAEAENPEIPSEAEKEGDPVEKARNVVCNFGLFKGKTLGEMMETEKGYQTVKWLVQRYKGEDRTLRDAAALLLEHQKSAQKAA